MMRRFKAKAGPVIFFSSLLLALFALGRADADTMAPRINLNTVMDEKEPGVLKVQVLDDTRVSNVTLYYRKKGEAHYNSISMQQKGNDIFYRELQKELGLEGPIEYYLVAQDTSGNQSSLPQIAPEDNPMKGSSDGSSSIASDEIVLSSPEAGAVYTTGDQMVMVTFYNSGRQVDLNTVRMKINKIDRTSEISFVGNILMWEPRRPFPDGEHEIEITAKDKNGEPMGPNIWTFQVKTKAALPLGAEGDFYVGIQHDDRSSNSANVPLWNNKIDLGVKGQSGGINWRAGVMLSSEETSFLTSETLPDRQPINRYYFEGSSKHWKVLFGDSNPDFSDLSLKGVLVRGLNLEFKSNRFNSNVVYGYNKREIDDNIQIVARDYRLIGTDLYASIDGTDTLSTASPYVVALIDQETGNYNIYEYIQGTPKRNVWGLKMDVAPIRNRIADWKIGFNFFSAEDDTSTINYNYDKNDQVRYVSYRDSLFNTDYKPSKNWVGTLQSTLGFNNNQTVLSAEFGGTIATENMFSTVTPDIKDDLPENIDSDLFPINGSTQTSFDKLKMKDNMGKGLSDAITSVYKFRFNTVVPIPMTKTRFTAEAYRIPTHYVSLGNPQQRTDIGGMKFGLKTRTYKDQLSFDLGLDTYSDNLDKERKQYKSAASNLKDLTKDTNIAYYSVTYSPSKWADYSPSIGFGVRTYDTKNNLDLKVAANDTVRMIDASTKTYMLNLGGVLPVGQQRHNVIINFSNMSIADNRPLKSYDLSESDNLTVLLNLNSQINPMPLSLNTSFGYTGNSSYQRVGTAITGYDRKSIDTGISMYNIAGTYKWFRDKRLKTTLGFGYLKSSNGESGVYAIDNSKVSFKLEADYNLNSVSSVGAFLRYHNFKDKIASYNDYTEPVFGMNLKTAF
jgi:hypothetical protein